MSNMEQTLSIIKPDAVERNLIENIKSIFIKNRMFSATTRRQYNKSPIATVNQGCCGLVPQESRSLGW